MSDERHLPNLFLAGVPKAGTTSLYSYLTQHPDICPPRGRKELDFFTPVRWGKPIAGTADEYAKAFDHCIEEQYRLDASPQYFDGGSELVEAVKGLAPHARILILLRDPVHRLWSHFRDLRGKDKLAGDVSFREFLKQGINVQVRGRGQYQDFSNYRAASLGCYNEFLRDWLNVFDDDVLVLFYEHLVRDPQSLVASVCGWLGVDPKPAYGFDYTARNETVDPRSIYLSKMAYALNRRIGPTLNRFPTAKKTVRSTYALVNRRQQAEQLKQEDQDLAEGFYLEANRALWAELTRRNYVDLPEWLSTPPRPMHKL